MSLDRFCFQNGIVSIEKLEAAIRAPKATLWQAFKWTRFPLALSWACTIHKVQRVNLRARCY